MSEETKKTAPAAEAEQQPAAAPEATAEQSESILLGEGMSGKRKDTPQAAVPRRTVIYKEDLE